MSDVPETRYTKSGEVHIAYQVVGKGALDLVLVWGTLSQVELLWEDPASARFLNRLASFSRLIQFDKRGTGLSDRISGVPTLEERMDDVRAVMDAVGSQRAAIFGESEGGPMSALFAATYPERTLALILYGAFALAIASEDFPWAPARLAYDSFVDYAAEHWGEGVLADLFVPSIAADPEARRWIGRYERQALSPGAFRELFRANAKIDVRPVLPTISVPTLVLHREDDGVADVHQGRYLADRIPGARYVELEGRDHPPQWGDAESVLEETQEFLTGVRHGPEPERVFATVLFTDIVASTEHAARLGDRGWRDLLDRHDALVRRQVERFGGRLVSSAGDGMLATFDGPARAIRCAQAITQDVPALGIEVRAGLHAGEVETRGQDVAGIAVNMADRVAKLAGPCEVLVSRTVTDLVAGSGIEFEERGVQELKGLPGKWALFAVRS